MRAPHAVSIHGKCMSLLPLNQGVARNTSLTESQATWSWRTWEGRKAERLPAVPDLLPLTWALKPPYHVYLNHSSSHQTRRRVSTLRGAARAFHPSHTALPALLLPLTPQSALPGEVRGSFAGARGWSSHPSLTSLEWFSWRCHGNGACSHIRGNVCGIQPLPGVGRRETAFYPVQVPTVGRDGRVKMGGRGGNRNGS